MTTHTHPKFGGYDILVAVAMNVMWGLNLIAVKMGVDLVQPLTAAWLRQVMVMLICLPALRIVEGKMRELILLGALAGGAFYIIVNISMAVSTNVSALAIAGQLGAPFSLILAIIFLGERVHKYRIAGMALAFAGVVMIVFDPHAADERLGLGLTAIASFIWACCSLIQRRLIGVPVLTIYAWVGLCGTLVLLPIALIAEPEAMASVSQLPIATLGWILFSALGSTVIGQGAMSTLLQRHPVSTVVPLTLPTPVISVMAAAYWFGTPLTPVMIAGGGVVLAGVAIVTLRTAQAGEAKRS
ncbi:MAG: EamA family transporter [Alphaproteobacteria bacterium]|nr:EamA family transporter [Alphaproteobacteria bacterium]